VLADFRDRLLPQGDRADGLLHLALARLKKAGLVVDRALRGVKPRSRCRAVHHRARSCGCLWVYASQHVGERSPGSCRCDSTRSQLGPGTGAELGVLAAAAGFAALVTQTGGQHGCHDGPPLGISAPWCREVMASTDHGLRASGASVAAGPGVPLERDAAGRARVVQLVGLLGVVAHAVNVPGIVVAGEDVSVARAHGRVRMRDTPERGAACAPGAGRRGRTGRNGPVSAGSWRCPCAGPVRQSMPRGEVAPPPQIALNVRRMGRAVPAFCVAQ
jgi:hypothetical protein